MKIIKKSKKYILTFRLNQFPWSLKKTLSLQKRKWGRTKFSSRYIINTSKRIIRSKTFKTYRQKTKKLFKQFYAPHLNERQFKKLFRSNLRYKTTFKRALDLEYRLDTIVYRIFMLSCLGLSKDLILNKFVKLNHSVCILPKTTICVGDIIELSNIVCWKYIYNHMVEVNASLKKYLNRIFNKFSFPFVLKKHNRRQIEFGKFRKKKIQTFTKGAFIKLKRRVFFEKYVRLKPNTKSLQRPRKVYVFKYKGKEENVRNIFFVRTIKPSKSVFYFLRALSFSEFPKVFFHAKKRIVKKRLQKQFKFVSFLKKNCKKKFNFFNVLKTRTPKIKIVFPGHLKKHNRFLNINYKKLLKNKFKYSNYILKSKRKKRSKKPYFLKKKRWFGIKPMFSFQRYRVNKKIGITFKYQKKFNNQYRNFATYKEQNYLSWGFLNNSCYKTSFLFDKKKKRLLSQKIHKGIIVSPTQLKIHALSKNNLEKKKLKIQKGITRFKRKYLLIKGFYRKYKDFKLEFLLAKKTIYKPIQIQYKLIDLIFKHRPIHYYFAEMNLKTLKTVVMSDVDLYTFPYRSLLDFKTMSHLYKF